MVSAMAMTNRSTRSLLRLCVVGPKSVTHGFIIHNFLRQMRPLLRHVQFNGHQRLMAVSHVDLRFSGFAVTKGVRR